MRNRDLLGADITALDHAITILTDAAWHTLQSLGKDHDAFKAVELANERTRVAREKLFREWKRLS